MSHHRFIIRRVDTLVGVDKYHIYRLSLFHYTVYKFSGITYMQTYVGPAGRGGEKFAQIVGIFGIYLHRVYLTALRHSLGET